MAKIKAVTEVNAGSVMSSALTFETAIAGVVGERVRIGNTGNVGIGTDSPSEILHITSSNPEIYVEDTAGDAVLRLRGGNSSYINAAVLLQSSDAINGNSNDRGMGTFMHDEGGENEWFIGRPYSLGSAGNDAFVVNRSTSSLPAHSTTVASLHPTNPSGSDEQNLFTIRNDGKIGIGTTSPAETLHISGASGAHLRIDNATGPSALVLTASNYTGGGTRLELDSVGFHIAQGTTPTNRFQILNNGNVGIGTTTPEQPLTVEGHISSSGNLYLQNGHPTIHLLDTDGAAEENYGNIKFNGGTLSLYSRNASSHGHIDFKSYNGTDTLTRMAIDSEGKVGIGTTTPGAAFNIETTDDDILIFSSSHQQGGRMRWISGSTEQGLIGWLVI